MGRTVKSIEVCVSIPEDGTSLQKLCSALPPGSVVNLPPSTICLTQTLTLRDVSLRGAGPGQTIITLESPESPEKTPREKTGDPVEDAIEEALLLLG